MNEDVPLARLRTEGSLDLDIMHTLRKSYLNPKIKVAECRLGKGLFVVAPLAQGELVIDWRRGPGVHMSTEEAYQCEAAGNKYTLQVDDNQHLVSIHVVEACDYINHSCRPNCGMIDAYRLVTLRAIEPQEEIYFDYAMTEAAEPFRLHCHCGTDQCRKVITGHDWKMKTLQDRYGNYFSPYILKKIRESHNETSTP